jgi:hypothetical protein
MATGLFSFGTSLAFEQVLSKEEQVQHLCTLGARPVTAVPTVLHTSISKESFQCLHRNFPRPHFSGPFVTHASVEKNNRSRTFQEASKKRSKTRPKSFQKASKKRS